METIRKVAKEYVESNAPMFAPVAERAFVYGARFGLSHAFELISKIIDDGNDANEIKEYIKSKLSNF